MNTKQIVENSKTYDEKAYSCIHVDPVARGMLKGCVSGHLEFFYSAFTVNNHSISVGFHPDYPHTLSITQIDPWKNVTELVFHDSKRLTKSLDSESSYELLNPTFEDIAHAIQTCERDSFWIPEFQERCKKRREKEKQE